LEAFKAGDFTTVLIDVAEPMEDVEVKPSPHPEPGT
jgi:hypothetical protein